jgi:hypothetical protein
MRDKEPRPIGRLSKHVRALFDAVTREELPQAMRQLVDKLQQAEPVKPPRDDKKPLRNNEQ